MTIKIVKIKLENIQCESMIQTISICYLTKTMLGTMMFTKPLKWQDHTQTNQNRPQNEVTTPHHKWWWTILHRIALCGMECGL